VQDRVNALLGDIQVVTAEAIKTNPNNPTWQLNVIAR
jgi:hypothetical protein